MAAKKKAGNGKKGGANKDVVLVVGSKLKDVVKSAGCQSSGELIGAVSAKVHEMVSAACARASSNGRKTVRAHDL